MRLLLVEDDVELATWLVKALSQSAFNVEWTNDGIVAERILRLEEFDAVILDLGLPAMSGHGVLTALRAAENRVPVLILTARDSVEERVSSLNQGADDFLAKPFSLAELEARLLALIRRSNGRDHPRLACGPLAFDIRTRRFMLSGEFLPLTPREHATLLSLIQRVGQPVSKQTLLNHIYAETKEVHDEAVEVHIHRLRKKMAGAAVRIVTMRGFGYCLELEHLPA